MYNKIRKPLLATTIIVLIIFLIVSISASFSDQILLSKIAGVIESVTLFALVIQVIVAADQNRLTLESLKVSDSRHSKEKAVEMARYFEEEILYRCSFISAIYEFAGVDRILKKVYRKQMNYFDCNEMEKLLSAEEIVAIQSKIENLNGETPSSFLSLNHPLSGRPILEIKADALNKLEFFCMYFNYGLADEGIVYQSLHQLFLDTISLLYYDISIKNTDPCDKYYTNVIKLFVMWRDRNEQMEAQKAQSEEQIKKDLTHEGEGHFHLPN